MIFFIFQARRNKTRKATVISILQQRRKKNDVIGIQTVKTHAGPNKGL